GVDHLLSVERDGHLIALAADAQRVPFPRLLLGGLRGRDDAVDGRRVLEGFDVLVDLGIVIEDLNLHSKLGDVALARRADIDAAVPARRDVEFELDFKITVLILREEGPALSAFAGDFAVLPLPGIGGAAGNLPPVEILAVEERYEFLLVLSERRR